MGSLNQPRFCQWETVPSSIKAREKLVLQLLVGIEQHPGCVLG